MPYLDKRVLACCQNISWFLNFFSFPLWHLAKICSECVPIKFSWCSHQVSNIFPQIPNVFPNMFSIAPQFVPYALPNVLEPMYVAEPIFLHWGVSKVWEFFSGIKKRLNWVLKILNLEGRHPDLIKMNHIRVIHNVRKTEHQNPKFGHTQGKIIKKKLQKSTLAFKGRMKLRKPANLW